MTESESAQKVWRYMKFSRFVWLLQNRQLWLSRSDLLGDVWELTPSHVQVAIARNVTGLNAVEPTYMAGEGALEMIVKNWRSRTFVNCWTALQAESHALWRIYCEEKEGVAIQTTLARLRKSAHGHPVHHVIYRDPESRPVDRDNVALTELVIEKRPMFAYEHEVRIIMKAPQPSQERGFHLPWDVESAVENVYVHPEADGSFFATVQTTVSQHAPLLSERVRWSAMKTPPPF